MAGKHFLVDWHNYGSSILALSPVGRRFCGVSKVVEKAFGRRADHAFCVSNAMRTDLIANWDVSPSRLSLLYDQPPSSFHSLSPLERHAILFRYFPKGCLADPFIVDGSASSLSLPSAIDQQILNYLREEGSTSSRSCLDRNSRDESISFTQAPDPSLSCNGTNQNEDSMFTTLARSPSSIELNLLPDRPAMIVTSTSWTPDEDLDLLLDSLCMYDAEVKNGKKIPPLFLVVTGLGQGREAWIKKAAEKSLTNVTIRSVFLPFEDYWRILGAADLGICLHTSSSGLDLPMKVVDMRGVCLPVLAFNFPALSELVKPGVTGEVFRTAEELTRMLVQLLSGFPMSHALTKLRLACENAKPKNWDSEWQEQAHPVFSRLLAGDL